MPLFTPPTITVSLPGSGTYMVQETSPSSLTVSGGNGDLADFADNAKLAVESAVPKLSTEMTGVENNGGELVGIFQIDGGDPAAAFQSGPDSASSSQQLTGRPNWVAVLPLTISGGKPEWNNSDKWSQSWLVPASLSGIPIIELAPDTQDIKEFQGTLSDLSSPQAAQAAGQVMAKYNVAAVVVAAYDEQSQQVSVWLYPGSQTNENSADNISSAHAAALSSISSLVPTNTTTPTNTTSNQTKGNATPAQTQLPNAALLPSRPTPTATPKSLGNSTDEHQIIAFPGYQINASQ